MFPPLQRLARLVPALAMGLCAASAGLLILSAYQLLRPNPGHAPLPNFMRQLRLPAPQAQQVQPAGAPATQRTRACPCAPGHKPDELMVRLPLLLPDLQPGGQA